ncbi:MAG: hypothetical protein ACK54W_22370 [Alphaproteobacteria bacterium]
MAQKGLISAVPALQAIGTVVAIEKLIGAPARDQRVIPGVAKEPLTSAVPAPQAIVAGVALENLIGAPARDQRVIPG